VKGSGRDLIKVQYWHFPGGNDGIRMTPQSGSPERRTWWSSGYCACHWTKDSLFKPGQGRWIFEDDDDVYRNFLERGSEVVGPMS
jgi:hypothetical protein